MNPDRVAAFPLSPDLVMLNHASFGLPTRAVMDRAQCVREALELDALALIDVDALVPQLRDASAATARQLGLSAGALTLTHNATTGAAALMRSLALRAGGTVVVLSTEYDSVLRGWRVRCEETGAALRRVEVPLPLQSADQLVVELERQVAGDVSVAQLSLVASSTAIAFPVGALSRWFRDRGARVVLDVAHGPGHVALEPRAWGVSAMFGTIHKWFPSPRPVGMLWVDDDLRDVVRPAEVSLTWDSDDLVERFSWPGTFDPTPRLCVADALAAWEGWRAAGELERCGSLADYASAALERIGGVPTSPPGLRAPRLRAVVLPARSRDDVRAALERAGVRAWTGVGPNGETMLRVATHVYNDAADVDRLCEVVGAA
jgi:isopenicillin-N epimerase